MLQIQTTAIQQHVITSFDSIGVFDQFKTCGHQRLFIKNINIKMRRSYQIGRRHIARTMLQHDLAGITGSCIGFLTMFQTIGFSGHNSGTAKCETIEFRIACRPAAFAT